ncbi:acyl-CoA dehydrogenase family protein [Nonomuraea rhodomycinica]|uniref:Acyl-CoA/acyl-ACP dehydrogenase n=1 Tax=Nonomuraea rhodomycinica TaxID=1712872 RepID=A0A7Y6M841_9ACTN|nr:acyl-CoA dehydrogenase family protein [Nonomuraea rhodomycinica]NUW38703.1 acyl-CoA/acyl-ACP dehydrogenase [Nonomuraea rhodomycinica]
MVTDNSGAPDAIAAAREVLPTLHKTAAEVDADARFPEESLAALRASGLMGLLVPRHYGGLGGTLDDLVRVAQVLAGGCLSTAMIFAMHCQQVDALVHFAQEELRERILPHIAKGKIYLASITSERESGGHLLTGASPLEPTADGLLLKRDAPVVTGGAHADAYLVTMRSRPESSPNRVTLVLVDRHQADVEFTGEWDSLGMRGTHSIGLTMRATVPTEQIIGEDGEFRRVAVESFMPLAHIGWSACWLGTATEALRELVTVLRSAKRPKSLDIGSDLLHERIARIRQRLELISAYLRLVTDEVADHRNRGKSLDSSQVQIHLNILKITAAELAYEVSDHCVQVAGLGIGYLRNSPIPFERHLRDLRSAALNYSNDRLLRATGLLALSDSAVGLI